MKAAFTIRVQPTNRAIFLVFNPLNAYNQTLQAYNILQYIEVHSRTCLLLENEIKVTKF